MPALACPQSSFAHDEVARDQLYALMAQLTDADLIAASYSLSDLLTECSIGGVACNTSSFSSFLHPQYGQCFLFSTNSSLTRLGMDKGLRMLITTHQDISSSSSIDLLPTTGIRLSVHPSGYYSSLDTRGLTLGVGLYSLVGLTKARFIIRGFFTTDMRRIYRSYLTIVRKNIPNTLASNAPMADVLTDKWARTTTIPPSPTPSTLASHPACSVQQSRDAAAATQSTERMKAWSTVLRPLRV
ncbi:hypothetical protein PRIPAC_81839 [Pristionchus pacificus]|nr:hypothetical protein PRIPAC_81839 [Pristionchus pacificus]